MMSEIKVQSLEERHVAFVSYTGNYMGNAAVFGNLINKIMSWAGPKGLMGPNALLLASYQDDPNVTPPEELVLDICLTVPLDTKAEGDVQTKVLPGGEYAVMHAELTGPDEYGPAWMKVVNWAKENGHDLDLSRPSYEYYLNDPQSHPEKHHILDICLSVKKK